MDKYEINDSHSIGDIESMEKEITADIYSLDPNDPFTIQNIQKYVELRSILTAHEIMAKADLPSRVPAAPTVLLNELADQPPKQLPVLVMQKLQDN